MSSDRHPKLRDVARVAGVSLATASRALSEPGVVKEATREHVKSVAAMLGYMPSGAARALASRRSRTLGAVFPPVDNPIFAAATQALAHELAGAGYTLLLATHEYDPAVEVQVTRTLLERGVDGLVLIGLDHSPELFELLSRSRVPYEITWSIDSAGYHPCVGIPHRAASARVTQHLLDLGHREFAVVAGVTAHNDRVRERLAGVRDALTARGIELRVDRVIDAEFSVAQGRRAFLELLERAPGFTAVICGNDTLALGVMTECARRGLRIPEQLSVAGFENIELASEMTPALTTVHVPAADIGRLAGSRMLARLSGRHVPVIEELRAELIVRESTGKPPATVQKP